MRKVAGRTAKPKLYDGYYLVEVAEWQWEYHLAVNTSKLSEDPLSEIQTVDVSGPLLGPKSLTCRSAIMRLSANHQRSWSARNGPGEHQPPWVGTLRKAGELLEGHIHVPPDAMRSMVALLAVDRMKMLVMFGPKLFRGEAILGWFSAATKLAPEDYPDDYC